MELAGSNWLAMARLRRPGRRTPDRPLLQCTTLPTGDRGGRGAATTYSSVGRRFGGAFREPPDATGGRAPARVGMVMSIRAP